MKKLSDQEFIGRYLKGDEKSFDFLMARYVRQVYGFVFKYVNSSAIAEDITQEVFLKIWRNLKKVHHNKNAMSWIYTSLRIKKVIHNPGA